MKITQLDITHFRGIKQASFLFKGHTLLVGKNNVGKSSICEALDLVLGPDRLNRVSAIDEYDFYNGDYSIDETGNGKQIIIEAVLVDISEELESIFRSYLEFWHLEENRVLAEGEIDKADDELVNSCLRLKFIGQYDPEEDEFSAKTYFSHSPNEDDGVYKEVSKTRKRQIGFLYLRAIRTGRRALSLERGSLLDILLRVGELRPKFWEDTRSTLINLDPPLDENIGSLRKVLDNIEQRIGQYISLPDSHKTTRLHVSQLTREHLRKTLSFFMSSSVSQSPVPFQKLGTGTLNTLVFALLSAIAELKKENIIFAMEEPEIAVPPHTQRRIVDYLLSNTTQSFVTSHSPYVIEKFEPEQIKILRKDESAVIVGKDITLKSGFKSKNYRRKIRHAIAEVILGNAVIIGEGLTELEVLSSAAKIIEDAGKGYPLDLSGVTIFEAGGDGTLIEYGRFFKSIGIKTFAFFDKMERTEEQTRLFKETFDYYKEIDYKGIEKLLSEEVPTNIQWKFLKNLKKTKEIKIDIPDKKPEQKEVSDLIFKILKKRKGERRSAALIEKCNSDELPKSIVEFFSEIYSRFPIPNTVEQIDFSQD